jgi:uncharacterized protein (DUF58 family)
VPAFRGGFTTRASCLLAAGGTAVLCGLVLGIVDLVRAGVLALAIPIAAAATVFRSRVRIATRRSVEPERAPAGTPVTVHLEIANSSLLRTGALLLEDHLPPQLSGRARFVVPSLTAHESQTVSYRLPALRRGRYRVGPLRVRLTDPFHMVDVIRSFEATSEFLVAPVVDHLPNLEPPRSYDIGDNAGSHSIGAHGADDASTREYRTGDDLRKIHWRSTARAGALMVRMEERPWQGRTTLLVDLRANAHASGKAAPDLDLRDVDSLEWAISAVASIGSHLITSGREVTLVDDQSGNERLRFENPAALTSHLAVVQPSNRPDLGPLAAALHTAARESALVAVVGHLDAVSVQVLADAHPRGATVPAFALLLDVASWRDDPSLDDRALERDRAAKVLRAAGWRVAVVRRGQSVAEVWAALLRARADVASALETLR